MRWHEPDESTRFPGAYSAVLPHAQRYGIHPMTGPFGWLGQLGRPGPRTDDPELARILVSASTGVAIAGAVRSDHFG
jgi:hypothetical protein